MILTFLFLYSMEEEEEEGLTIDSVEMDQGESLISSLTVHDWVESGKLGTPKFVKEKKILRKWEMLVYFTSRKSYLIFYYSTYCRGPQLPQSLPCFSILPHYVI